MLDKNDPIFKSLCYFLSIEIIRTHICWACPSKIQLKLISQRSIRGLRNVRFLENSVHFDFLLLHLEIRPFVLLPTICTLWVPENQRYWLSTNTLISKNQIKPEKSIKNTNASKTSVSLCSLHDQ